MSQRALLDAGICYVPQGRNIFPGAVGARTISSSAASSAGKGIDLPARIEAALDLFPALRRKSTQQASTLSGGEQKQLEIARSLLLEPKLVLIDEPSIGLSPLMVQQTFDILKSLRDRGVTILMIEQNARSALEISDIGIVLELGQTRMVDKARTHPERSADRPAVPRRRHGGERGMSAPMRIGCCRCRPDRPPAYRIDRCFAGLRAGRHCRPLPCGEGICAERAARPGMPITARCWRTRSPMA